MNNFIVNTDIPNLRVVIREGDQYNINIVPGRINTLRTGSFNTYSDFAGFAYSASVVSVSTASYAETINPQISGSVVITGSLSVEQSIQSSEFKLNAGEVSIIFTGSINSGIFGVSEYVEPFISMEEYAGASIEYIAQRPGATRMGIIMATWANGSTLTFTDISTADVGDTSDISFIFLPSGSYYRLRVNSGGIGSGTWTVQSLFKLFPNLGS